MGGVVEGLFFDCDSALTTRVGDLGVHEVQELFYTGPFRLAEIVHGAVEAGNPELGAFVLGVLGSRSYEPSIRPASWAERRNISVRGHAHPSERSSHEEYRKAFDRAITAFAVEVQAADS
jgi:hypothetical protein